MSDRDAESASDATPAAASDDEASVLDRHDGGTVDPRELADVDMASVPDEALPTDDRCPKCHYPVFGVTSSGPDAHVLSPCGCRVMVLDF
ncbi:hypothetical protein [Halovivax gelatinilyticus]|uniref:hypothetical protein n=1 Tax=Halovivax gelatinilyticus TaxID=2961597 RepID=UPI0020CA6A5F|nr:hypothetical protein [Halovivax gelatinilyticus]